MIKTLSYIYLLLGLSITASIMHATEPNTVIAIIPGFSTPYGIAVTPDNNFVYVANAGSTDVLVIDSNPSSPTFNILVNAPALIGVFTNPNSIAITPNGLFAYVSNGPNNTSMLSIPIRQV